MTGRYLNQAEADQSHADRLWATAAAFEDALALAKDAGLSVDVAYDGTDIGLKIARVQLILPTQACSPMEAQVAIIDAHDADETMAGRG